MIRKKLAQAIMIHQAEQLIANDLDVLFVEDLAIDEVDHGHIANVFYLQATATGLCGHGLTLLKYTPPPHGSFTGD